MSTARILCRCRSVSASQVSRAIRKLSLTCWLRPSSPANEQSSKVATRLWFRIRAQPTALHRRRDALAASTLQDALRNNEFRLEAQPIVGLRMRAERDARLRAAREDAQPSGELLSRRQVSRRRGALRVAAGARSMGAVLVVGDFAEPVASHEAPCCYGQRLGAIAGDWQIRARSRSSKSPNAGIPPASALVRDQGVGRRQSSRRRGTVDPRAYGCRLQASRSMISAMA